MKEPSNPPPGSSAGIAVETSRRFEDPRGATAIIAEGSNVEFIEYVEFNSPGDVRGGHFHADYTERFHVLAGQLKAEFLDTAEERAHADVEELTLSAGMTAVIPAGVAHRFTALAPTRAVAFGHGSSPLADRTRIDLTAGRSTQG
jgi:dTDP-4-dehydrorhamnose 3,5-epimerase-like enzyme